MEEIIKQLNKQFEQFNKEKNEYDRNKKIEIFQDDETKPEDELINQAESMLDRRIQETEKLPTSIFSYLSQREKFGDKQNF